MVVPSYNGINVGTGDFTLGAWVNRDSSSGASSTRIIIDKRAVTGIGYSFAVSSGSLLLQMTSIAGNPANHLDTNSVPLDNRWHFVTVTVARSLTNSVVRFFLDGTPTAILNTSVPPGSLDNTMPLRVGSSIFPGMDPWMGGMDEVVVFARALTAQEIQAIAGAGSVGQCKTPCAVPIFVQGATNKVVNCGTDWKFDLPTATSCCSVGVQIVSAGLATNGICPKTITQSWLITDDCGNSTTCSQTVTLRDTQPPTLVCAKNTIIVALNVGCQLEIPTIQPPATDNCTPASQLVYSQTPSAGAILPGPCQIVTVTVMDACKNVSQCQVLVCGQDQTPPTLHYPKFVTVTNCLVPDVLAQVSAADNCTASRQLVFSQLPSAGTPIAAGGNLVAVNVTDLAGNMTSVVVPLVASGLQSFLDVLFDTGVDSNRVVLGTGAIDPHYTLGPVPIGSPTGPGAYNAPNAVVVSAGWGWPLSPFTSSGWIAPELPCSDTYTAAGSYTYTNLFVLPPGADPLTASVSGRWAADGSANMYLNGLAAANGAGSPITAPGYDHWTPFTVNSGFLAFPAVNRLYFVVTNGQGYGDGSKFPALRVEITAAVANCSACTPPVILHQILNQSLPLNSTAVFSVSMWGTPPFTFQWYHNGLALANGGRYSGVNTPTLTLTPLSYADAGSYYTAVSNSCGQTASAPVKLTVGRGWGPWPWAWWDFALIGSPMRATVGPDLIMEGTNTLGISSGTTIDFGLPNLGGKIANVMDVLPLPSNTFIRLPYLGSDSNVTSYTLIMDVCVPSNSDARATFFTIFDRWGNMMDLGITPGAAGEVLSLQGTVGGATFSLVYPPALSRGASPAWNRIALVVENTAEPGMGDQAQGMLTTYLNGKPAGIKSFAAPAGSLASDIASMVTIMSSPVMGTKRESFVSSLQFHAVAFTPEMLAGIGSPDNGPLRANDTSVGLCPALSATTSNGVVNLSWTGSAFLLQETSDVRHGAWIDSTLPFDEAEVNGEITTTAHANPAMEGQEKFYRLTYVP